MKAALPCFAGRGSRMRMQSLPGSLFSREPGDEARYDGVDLLPFADKINIRCCTTFMIVIIILIYSSMFT